MRGEAPNEDPLTLPSLPSYPVPPLPFGELPTGKSPARKARLLRLLLSRAQHRSARPAVSPKKQDDDEDAGEEVQDFEYAVFSISRCIAAVREVFFENKSSALIVNIFGEIVNAHKRIVLTLLLRHEHYF